MSPAPQSEGVSRVETFSVLGLDSTREVIRNDLTDDYMTEIVLDLRVTEFEVALSFEG